MDNGLGKLQSQRQLLSRRERNSLEAAGVANSVHEKGIQMQNLA